MMIQHFDNYTTRARLRASVFNSAHSNSIEDLRKKDILRVDTTSMLKSANKEMKTLLFNLNKVMNSGNEEVHRQLYEN
jgi:hypothetical protein